MADQPSEPATDTPVIHLDLKDPELKKRVTECIEKNNHLKVFLHPQGSRNVSDATPYRRID